MADSNRVGIEYYIETTPGVIAGTRPVSDIRFTGESLNYTIASTKSAEIRSDRMTADTVQTAKDCGGAIEFEFSAATYDDFIKGAMMGSWATNVIKNGSTKYTYALQRRHEDMTPIQYFRWLGMQINSWSMNIASGAIVTGSFDFIGLSHAQGTTKMSTGTLTAANTNPVFNAIGNVGTLKEGGVALSGVYIQSISFTLNNNLRPLKAIGSVSNVMVGVGSCDISGQMNVYFTDTSLYTKFLNATATSLEFTVSGDGAAAGLGYTFLFPKIKYESLAINTPGIDTDIMQNISFRALKDTATTNAMLQITRDVTP